MRKIVNISLPSQMFAIIKREVKTGRYATTSEFFRHLLRKWEENRILDDIKANRKELKAGGGKVLKSLKDLR